MSNKLKFVLVLSAKLLIAVVVVLGVIYTFRRAFQQFNEQGTSLAALEFWWLVVAGLAYLVGIVPCWLFWHRTLLAMGQSPTLAETFRAYYISHLGKYVPGKAMVVILRTGWVGTQRTTLTAAAVSVFIETLTMMSVASLMACAILLVCYRENPLLLLLAPVVMICAGAPTLPPILRRLVRWLQVKRLNPQIEQSLLGVDFRLMFSGWAMIAPGWLILGISLWATLRAIPGVEPKLSDLPIVIACLALSVVAGFVSLLPGGLGARELVATALLQNALGYSTFAASLSAVLLRLSWMVSEVVILIILYVGSILHRYWLEPSRETVP